MESENKSNTQLAIYKARSIMESFDPSGSMTVGYDEPTYTLTAEEMGIIAGALYLADCDLDYLK
jgi:hypothetical protein